MDQQAFVGALGRTFEKAPWVAEAAWKQRPFKSVDQLHHAMMEVVRAAPDAQQLEFLRGHPQLAGKEAQAGTMTNESTSEQASAGLNALPHAEFEKLKELNKEYLDRHGFPFIIAVRNSTKAEIFDEIRRRIDNSTSMERETALDQISFITRGRIDKLFDCSK